MANTHGEQARQVRHMRKMLREARKIERQLVKSERALDSMHFRLFGCPMPRDSAEEERVAALQRQRKLAANSPDNAYRATFAYRHFDALANILAHIFFALPLAFAVLVVSLAVASVRLTLVAPLAGSGFILSIAVGIVLFLAYERSMLKTFAQHCLLKILAGKKTRRERQFDRFEEEYRRFRELRGRFNDILASVESQLGLR